MQTPQFQKLCQSSYFFKWLHEQNLNIYDLFPPSKNIPIRMEIDNEQVKSMPQTDVSSDEKKQVEGPLDQSSQEEESEFICKTRRIRNRIRQQQLRQSIKKGQDKDPDFNFKVQKRNRNVLSNLCHHLFKFLQSNPGVDCLVQKIIALHQLDYSKNAFRSKLEKNLKSLRTYVTEKHLRSLLFGNIQLITGESRSEGQSGEFYLIMRILSMHFFQRECFNSILLSNKLSGQSKLLHFGGIREISQMLTENSSKNRSVIHKKEAKSRKPRKLQS